MAVSGNLSTSNDRVKYNITVTESNVNTANNTSQITVSVKFWRTNTGYETYGTGTCYCTIDGTQYTQAVTSSQKITNAGIVLFKKTVTITHNSDGAKTVNVKAKIALGSVLSSDYQGFNVTLTKINTTPSAVSTFTITAGNGSYVALGDTVTLKWSAATGTVTGYELQYSRGNSGWKPYKTVTGTSTTDSFTSTDIKVNGAGCAVKYRIRAVNGTLASAWKESNTLYISGGMDIKVSGTWNNGSVWINVAGTWKRAKRIWMKVNGTWQQSK
ncbi:DUF859 family phage minor structural protein [Anaerotignum sp.]